jgi:transcriptional regulator with XRE-family HTH domain
MAGARTVWVQQREYRDVGAALADARARAGLSQQQLAKLLRKPQSFISNYERGQRRIDILELLRVVDALGGDPIEIFREILKRKRASLKLPKR